MINSSEPSGKIVRTTSAKAVDGLDEHWPARPDQNETHRYGNMIVHVITHGAHYRSQSMQMLKRLGLQVPVTQAPRWRGM